jgi:hypothetical protein
MPPIAPAATGRPSSPHAQINARQRKAHRAAARSLWFW